MYNSNFKSPANNLLQYCFRIQYSTTGYIDPLDALSLEPFLWQTYQAIWLCRDLKICEIVGILAFSLFWELTKRIKYKPAITETPWDSSSLLFIWFLRQLDKKKHVFNHKLRFPREQILKFSFLEFWKCSEKSYGNN